MKYFRDFLRKLDRSAFSVPLNYPLVYRLKKTPKNIFLRVIKSLFANLTMRGYEIYTNERIVEIPFLFRHLDLPIGSKILDFGCNESPISIELASMGHEVVGVDMNDYPLRHPNFKFVKGDFLKNPFADSSFDAVVAVSAVEHCGIPESYGSGEAADGDRKIIEEFLRILRQGGKLILTVPLGIRGLQSGPLGQRIYDSGSLSDLLEGLKLLTEEYYIGVGRKHWLPCRKEELAAVDSVSAGFAQGVACIYAEK